MRINTQTFIDAYNKNEVIVYDSKSKDFKAAPQAGKNQKACSLSKQLFSVYKITKDKTTPADDKALLKTIATQLFESEYHTEPGTRSLLNRTVSATKNLFLGYGLHSSDALLKKIQNHTDSSQINQDTPDTPEKKAFDALKKEADAGNAGKQHQLARIYASHPPEGEGPMEENEKKAFEYFLQAAKQNHIPSLLEVARRYTEGQGVEADAQQAKHYHDLSWDMMMVYRGLEKSALVAPAIDLGILKTEADAGDPEKQFLLASAYLKTSSDDASIQEKNDKQTFNYYKLAANQSHHKAELQVARCYLLGKGVQALKDSPDHYYANAANSGLAEAQYEFGYLLIHRSQQSDQHQGIHYLEQACETNHKEALQEMSRVYSLGIGVPQDEAKAAQYAARADLLN